MVKENKKSRLFGLWFGLSLICGLFAAGFLVALIWATLGNMISGDPVASSYSDGRVFVGLIAALVVFAAVYVFSTFKAGKELNAKRETNNAVKVLSILYGSFLAVPAVVMLILFIIPLIELGIGSAANTSASIAQCVSSAVSFVVLLLMAFYQLGFWKKWLRGGVWSVSFTVLTLATIVLFMIFPGAGIRGTANDQRIIDDLEKISSAISRFSNRNDKLPESLGDLGNGKLNRSIDNYEYRLLDNDTESEYHKYEICTDGFINDTTDGRYWTYDYGFYYIYNDFAAHTAGHNCFTLSEYIYISPYEPMPAEARDVDYNYFED